METISRPPKTPNEAQQLERENRQEREQQLDRVTAKRDRDKPNRTPATAGVTVQRGNHQQWTQQSKQETTNNGSNRTNGQPPTTVATVPRGDHQQRERQSEQETPTAGATVQTGRLPSVGTDTRAPDRQERGRQPGHRIYESGTGNKLTGQTRAGGPCFLGRRLSSPKVFTIV